MTNRLLLQHQARAEMPTTRQRTTSATDNATQEKRGRTRVSSRSKKSSLGDSARVPASESNKRHEASGVTSYDHQSYQDSKHCHRRHSAQDTSHAKTSDYNQRIKNPSTLFPPLPTKGRIVNELSAPDRTVFVRRTSYPHKSDSAQAKAPADVVLAFNVPGPTQTTRTSIHWQVKGSRTPITSNRRHTRRGSSGNTARVPYRPREQGSRSAEILTRRGPKVTTNKRALSPQVSVRKSRIGSNDTKPRLRNRPDTLTVGPGNMCRGRI
jgi:hypothetical protein